MCPDGSAPVARRLCEPGLGGHSLQVEIGGGI
jgi:hypothetical protein